MGYTEYNPFLFDVFSQIGKLITTLYLSKLTNMYSMQNSSNKLLKANHNPLWLMPDVKLILCKIRQTNF